MSFGSKEQIELFSILAPANAAKKDETTNPILGEYTDFRQYLRDVYEYRKKHEGSPVRPYSYSTFSAAADIKSPNYLKMIIEGRRNLSEEMITRFATALRLSKEEMREFAALVRYGQASNPLDRNQSLKALSDLRVQRSFDRGELDKKAMDLVPNWLGWVIHAMADQKNVAFNPETLLSLLRTNVSIDEVKKSLQNLFDTGRLVSDPSTGEVSKPKENFETAQEVPVALIRKLQSELIYLGIESLFRDSPKEREFGALTLAMTPEEFEAMRFELRQLRKRIHKDQEVKRRSEKGDRVYQLNIQLFPITNPLAVSTKTGELT